MKLLLNETEQPSSYTLYCKVKTTFHQNGRDAGRVVAQASSPATVPASLWLGEPNENMNANPEGCRHEGKPEARPTKP